jgi:hypothetical protein
VAAVGRPAAERDGRRRGCDGGGVERVQGRLAGTLESYRDARSRRVTGSPVRTRK